MWEPTQDKSTIIIHRQHNLIIYYNIKENSNWVIFGKCNEIDNDCRGKHELDCPITPEHDCNCGLRGIWI